MIASGGRAPSGTPCSAAASERPSRAVGLPGQTMPLRQAQRRASAARAARLPAPRFICSTAVYIAPRWLLKKKILWCDRLRGRGSGELTGQYAVTHHAVSDHANAARRQYGSLVSGAAPEQLCGAGAQSIFPLRNQLICATEKLLTPLPHQPCAAPAPPSCGEYPYPARPVDVNRSMSPCSGVQAGLHALQHRWGFSS